MTDERDIQAILVDIARDAETQANHYSELEHRLGRLVAALTERVPPPPRRIGPKAADHPSVGGICPACNHPFEVGDTTTLVTLGPADDPEARRAAREGRPYNARALEVHYSCVTGEDVL